MGLLPSFFKLPNLSISNSTSLTGDLVGAVIIVLLGSAFFTTVANLTTGVTISHSRFNNATITFTPNPNITSTPGYPIIIQLVPFVFGAMILVMVYAVFRKHVPGGL